MHKAARVSALLLLSTLVALSLGCKKEEHRLKFGHHQHVEVLEMTCDTCHVLSEGRMVRPTHESCACHAGEIEAEMSASEESCGHCHVFKKDELVMPEATERTPRVAFLHTEALAEQVDCASCHAPIVDTSTLFTPKVDAAERMRLMAFSHKLELDCAVCHEGVDKETKPADHLLGDWKRRHGRQAMMHGEESCSVCHDPVDTCQACHQTEPPRSHNNFWRLKSHGIEASVRRDSCMVCHQVDSCERCHANNAPLSHRAGWSSPANRHCYSCHATTGSRTGCYVCHNADAAAAHPSAPAPSPTTYHRPTASCLSCHGPNAGSGPPPQPRPELIRRLNPARHAILPEETCIACHRI